MVRDGLAPRRKWLRRVLFSNSNKRNGNRVPLVGIASHAAFAESLLKERARSERTSMPFALLVFDIELPRETTQYAKAMQVLLEILNERIRISDSKGWFDARVGVILTNIFPESVGIVSGYIEDEFSRRVRRRLDRQFPPPQLVYEIFFYPTEGSAGAGLEGFGGNGEDLVQSGPSHK